MLSIRHFIGCSRSKFNVKATWNTPAIWHQKGVALHTKHFSIQPPLAASKEALSESFLDGTSAVYIEEMYNAWRDNPASVHKSWDVFFRNSDKGLPPGVAFTPPPTLGGMAATVTPQSVSQGDTHQRVTDSMRLVLLIRAYQVRGHCIANLDPLGLDMRPEPPELQPSR